MMQPIAEEHYSEGDAALMSLRRRVVAEYLEMPGLRLTLAQAARLLGISRHTAQILLESLTEARLLRRAADGAYLVPSER